MSQSREVIENFKWATSEGSGEPVRPCSLATDFAAHHYANMPMHQYFTAVKKRLLSDEIF